MTTPALTDPAESAQTRLRRLSLAIDLLLDYLLAMEQGSVADHQPASRPIEPAAVESVATAG